MLEPPLPRTHVPEVEYDTGPQQDASPRHSRRRWETACCEFASRVIVLASRVLGFTVDCSMMDGIVDES